MKKKEIRQALAAIRLSRLPGVGAKVFQTLVENHKTPETVLECYLASLPKKLKSLPDFSRKKADTEDGIRRAEAFLETGGTVLFLGHPKYPALLAEISEPPPVLFIRGNLPEKHAIAIVGSRKSTSEGEQAAGIICRRVVEMNHIVVSGGALGIDSIAHETALKLKSPTIAVLGSGVDKAYPPSNYRLFEEIALQGALISELLPGTNPHRSFFPTRNRIVAGLSKAVIVIQAAAKSGALITARFAEKFNRPLFAVIPPSDCKSWAGNRILLEQGYAKPLDPKSDLSFC